MKIKLLNELAKEPTKGTEYSAGYDLYVASESAITIKPHFTKKINTGIAIELPEDTFGMLTTRSGIASKKGVSIIQGVGIIDEDYRGEILVPFHNYTNKTVVISPGEKIAQLIIVPYLPTAINIVDELSETVRGEGGFGSTDEILTTSSNQTNETPPTKNKKKQKIKFDDSKEESENEPSSDTVDETVSINVEEEEIKLEDKN